MTTMNDPRPTAVLLCPGRGSYGKPELGSITRYLRPDGPVAEALAEADRLRAAAGQPTITELDTAGQFRPRLHLEGRNAAELIHFATLAHLEHLREKYRIVAVAGNSLGWYSALPAAGSLLPTESAQMVRTMAGLQELAAGAQLLTTTVGADWLPDPRLVAEVDGALHATLELGPEFLVARSIRLGGHEVLAGTAKGVARLLELLPNVETEARSFPIQLAGHGPFHTELCGEVAKRATAELAHLPLRMPAVHLIDGRGGLHTPWSANPAELLHYTTDTQVRTTFDFTAAVRTAIREFQPDVLLCAGPGTSLRAPVGHVVLAERWRGIHSKQALFASGLVAVE